MSQWCFTNMQKTQRRLSWEDQYSSLSNNNSHPCFAALGSEPIWCVLEITFWSSEEMLVKKYKLAICNLDFRHTVECLVWRRTSNYRKQAKTDWSLVPFSGLPTPVKLSNLWQHRKQMLNPDDDNDLWWWMLGNDLKSRITNTSS